MSLIRFGSFEADTISGELRKNGLRLKLQQQPFQLLVLLAERSGEVVTREELQKRLWPDGVFVDFDRGLNRAINRLREVLCDDADQPRFIETVPQRGYRFIGELEKSPNEATADEPRPVEAPAPLLPPVPSPVRQWPIWAIAALLLVLVATLVAWRRSTDPGKVESIAVLPLENLSRDPAQEFFSDGMTDELIGELARIGSLRVISRTSVIKYKGNSRKSLPEIAKELDVDAIVEGTIAHAGGKVRITAQLIRARDDRHLWSAKFERDLVDVLALQGEVAQTIAAQIRVKLTPDEQTRLTRTHKVSPEAHEAFLRGRHFVESGLRGYATGADSFRRAIETDPAYADAHAGLAEALVYAGIFELQPSAQAHLAARSAALKALELDDASAAAHNVLADVKKSYEWDMAGAEKEYKRALELDGSRVMTRLWYAEYLSRREWHAAALAESARLVALDPVSARSHNHHSMLLWRARRYDESIRESQKALDLDPSFLNTYWWQGLSYAGKRDLPKAIATLQKAITIAKAPAMFLATLGYVHGLAGDKAKAAAVLQELQAMAKERYVSPTNFATVYAGTGDADAVFQWLEKAYQERDSRIHLLVSPTFDGLRADPRYAQLKLRIGL